MEVSSVGRWRMGRETDDMLLYVSRRISEMLFVFPFFSFSRLTCDSPLCLPLLYLLLFSIAILLYKRYRSYRMLADAKLPTIFWYPKFATLNITNSAEASKKLSDSTITNILPRMKRLNGPFGMYGTVYGLSTPVIHVAHGIPANAILQSTTSKTPAYDHFANFCGRGVFTADGDDWRAKRTSVLHALIRHQDIRPFAERAADQLISKLKACEQEGDIVPRLQTATVQLIYQYITRTDLAETNVPLKPYLTAITRIRMIILAQSRSVWFLLPRWCYRLFSSMYKTEEETMHPIRALARQACANAAPNSPLDALQKQPLYQVGSNALDEAITLLFAGQDTSAATLSWTLHLLSQHPEVQQKLADELCDGEASKNKYKLPYLDAVIKESMRLYPVAPFVVRKLNRDVIVPGVRLPKGAIACVWIYSLHRNPDLWDQPEQFIPERWFRETPKQAYMPFAAGPRNCVGQPLANVAVRAFLARLVSEFAFEPDSEQNCRKRMQAGFTVLPQDGLRLKLVPR